DRVVLWDRPNTDDQITAGKLTFSDGQSVTFGTLPNTAATGLTVTFPAHATTSLVMTVTAVSSLPKNIGLAEIEALGGPSKGPNTFAPAFTAAAAPPSTSVQANSFPVAASGQPTPTLAQSGALPAGLSFKDNANGTATISGTPSATGAPGT